MAHPLQQLHKAPGFQSGNRNPLNSPPVNLKHNDRGRPFSFSNSFSLSLIQAQAEAIASSVPSPAGIVLTSPSSHANVTAPASILSNISCSQGESSDMIPLLMVISEKKDIAGIARLSQGKNCAG